MSLTTWEVAEKYRLSPSYIRLLLSKKAIKGRQAPLHAKRYIWLIDEDSVKKFLKTKRTPGPRPHKKMS